MSYRFFCWVSHFHFLPTSVCACSLELGNDLVNHCLYLQIGVALSSVKWLWTKMNHKTSLPLPSHPLSCPREQFVSRSAPDLTVVGVKGNGRHGHSEVFVFQWLDSLLIFLQNFVLLY